MYKKRFLQFWILLLLLMIVFFAGAHAFAVEDAGGVKQKSAAWSGMVRKSTGSFFCRRKRMSRSRL